MTAQVGTIEIVIPHDASALIENCAGRLQDGEGCPERATRRVMLACPTCHLTTLWAYCDDCTRSVLRRADRGAVTKCCHAPLRVTVVEAL